MKNNFISMLLAVATGSIVFSACSSVTGKAPVVQPDSVKTMLFEDFSGPGLDSSRWNVEVTGMHVNNELQAYVDSSVTISFSANAEGAQNGALVLQPRFAPGFVTRDGQKFDFISGRINTRNKFEFAYGTASARIKLTDGAGLWPAWWLLGNGMWPETGEIDIMENIGEKDWANAAVHGKGYSGDAGLVNRLYFPDSNDVTNWHVYAVDWTPDSLVFKYDGIPMFRVTKSMITFFGPWAFDNPKYLILNFAVGGIYPFKINGLKQPYYGLSPFTFEQIKSGKSKMLVDWIRVTKK